MLKLLRNILLILVAVSFAILVGVLLILPGTIVDIAESLTQVSLLIRLPIAILLVVLVIALPFLIIRAERERHRAEESLQVRASGALADVSIESARTRIVKAVREVPNVVRAEAVVRALKGRADVDLDVVVSGDQTNIPRKQHEIDRALRQVINKQLGLQMAGKPKVHLRFENEEPAVTAPAAPVKPLSLSSAVDTDRAKVEPAFVPSTLSNTLTIREAWEGKSDSSTEEKSIEATSTPHAPNGVTAADDLKKLNDSEL